MTLQGFELIEGKLTNELVVRVYTTVFRLSKKIIKKLGNPKYLEIYFNSNLGLLAFKKEDGPHARSITVTKSQGYTLTSRSLIQKLRKQYPGIFSLNDGIYSKEMDAVIFSITGDIDLKSITSLDGFQLEKRKALKEATYIRTYESCISLSKNLLDELGRPDRLKVFINDTTKQAAFTAGSGKAALKVHYYKNCSMISSVYVSDRISKTANTNSNMFEGKYSNDEKAVIIDLIN